MRKTSFTVAAMDCPSEEEMIRMALSGVDSVRSLRCDIPAHTLEVYHTGGHDRILQRLEGLDLGTSFIASVPVEDTVHPESSVTQRKVLWMVLGINFFFFVLEVTTGFLSYSMGLIADGLDMLADAFVYGLALFAVGGSMVRKRSIARISGYSQLILAGAGFLEVVRRFAGVEDIPGFQTMIIMSVFALAGNATSLYLLQKSRSNEAHIRASMICTSNDVIANAGVIVAGILVYLSGSLYPDLIVGTIVLAIVGRGAMRILRLARDPLPA